MIINQGQSSVTTIGKTEKNKVGIDPNNINFITTLLSSNLYSHPERSFLREIVSNAWDSHVEAHKEDKPVIVIIEDSFVSIRDFGVGLSPERFKDIYLNIGSSTKRGDNTQIGGWGIGRFSALACSNSVEINSYYNGKLYKYLMIKDGNSVNIDLLMTLDTTEENGLEVKIPISYMPDYLSEMNYLVFFPNVYLKCDQYRAKLFNETKIKRYNNFAVCSENISTPILLGNVLYPLNDSSLSQEVRKIVSDICLDNKYRNKIAIKFDIGELDITPNREAILYSKRSIKVIEDRIKAAYNEIMLKLGSYLVKDYNDISICANLYSYRNNYYDLIVDDGIFGDNSVNEIKAASVINYYCQHTGKKVTYKGRSILDDLEKLETANIYIGNFRLPNVMYLKYNSKLYPSSNIPLSASKYLSLGRCQVLFIVSDKKLSHYDKEWIIDNYVGNRIVCNPFSINAFSRYIKESKGYQNSPLKQLPDDLKNALIEDTYNGLIKESLTFNPDTNKDFIDWKNEEIAARKANKVVSKDISIEVYENKRREGIDYYPETFFYKSVDDAVKKIESIHTGVVITNKRDDRMSIIRSLCTMQGYSLVLVNKTDIKHVETAKNYISVEKLITSKFVAKLHSVRLARINNFSSIIEHSDYISAEDVPHVRQIRELYNKANTPDLSSYLDGLPETFINPYITYCANLTKKYIDTFMSFHDKMEIISGKYISPREAAYTFFLYKTKTIRVPYSMYSKAKNKFNNINFKL